MPAYKFYIVDEAQHIVGPPQVLIFDDDDAAVARAKKIVNGHDLEVWEGRRFVAVIQSKDVR